MKNILVMAGTGIGLFVATAVGFLGMQGRLNYEGTRGIPLLADFFVAPEVPLEQGDEGQDAGHEVEQRPTVDLLDSNDGIQVIHDTVNIDEDGGGGHSAATEEEGGESNEGVNHSHESRQLNRARESLQPSPRDEWLLQNESARGTSGVFFSFPRMESSLTVKEINEIYRHAKATEDEVERRIEELDERELRLSQRERDVQDRADVLSDRIRDILGMERDLQDKVTEFEAKVLLVSRSQEEDLKPFADSLSAFDPKKAAEIVRSMWETEAGRLKISMVLKIMDPDVQNAILADMNVQEIRDILDNLLKVHREAGGTK